MTRLSNLPISYPRIRLQGQDVTDKAIQFIFILRQFMNTGLADTKDWVDEFCANSQLELSVPSDEVAMKLGGELLRSRFVSSAWLIGSPDDAGIEIPIAPPSPAEIKYLCPNCHASLKFPYECKSCDWLRFPSDRSCWAAVGPCPKCGFSYRWDGVNCSHCGNGAIEHPPLIAANP